MADEKDKETTPPLSSFDDIKNQVNELRQARKLKTIRLNAGLKYVSTKISGESEHRTSVHKSILNTIITAQSDLEKEKEP